MAGDVSTEITITFGAAVWLTGVALVLAQQLGDISLGFGVGLVAWAVTGVGVVVWIIAAIAWLFGG